MKVIKNIHRTIGQRSFNTMYRAKGIICFTSLTSLNHQPNKIQLHPQAPLPFFLNSFDYNFAMFTPIVNITCFKHQYITQLSF